MKKSIFIIIITVIFALPAYAQKSAGVIDSNTAVLKAYLSKNIKFPALEIKNYVEGKVVVAIRLNNKKMIDSIWFERHIDSAFDYEIIKALRSYPGPLILPESTYTIGFQFIILDAGEPDSKILPFNKTVYKNFLFELDITAELKSKPTIVY